MLHYNILMPQSNSSHGRHDRPNAHAHDHRHGPLSAHPPQPLPWSFLRMTVVSRLAAALAVSAGLWAIVLLAMR